MSNIDTDYLNKLVTRFKAYKSPKDTQLLIIKLGSTLERSKDDDKNLAILLKAEKKADELMKARAETNKLLTSEKAKQRKADTRKKIIWGAALKSASKDNAQIAQLMQKLYDDKYMSKSDQDAVRADYDALTTSNNSSS